MPFKTIPNITINGSNRFANGYIYGANFNIGYSENPTQVSFNLVPAEGATSFSVPPPNLTSDYTLNLGGIIFTKAKLIEATESTSVGQKILTVNFIDGSYILDKIYVGLINRHRQAKGSSNTNITVPMYCTNCEGNPSQKFDISIERKLDGSFTGPDFVEVDPKKGGVIILGIEQFTEGICDVPDVAYNFTSLKAACGQAGISINGISDLNPNYFQNYTGTLREVLSNWASDFGFTFMWDFTSNSIFFLDLKQPVISIENIYNTIIDARTVPVESINFSRNLNGTYDQSLVSYYLKPSRSKNNTLTRYERKNWNAIKLQDISQTELFSGRDATSFGVSASLQKYYPTARALYNFYYLGGGLPGVGSEYNVKLGMTLGLKWLGVDLPGAQAIFDNGFSNSTMKDTFNKYPGGYMAVYLYSRDLESRWEGFEVGVADGFIGKFYSGGTEPPKDVSECSTYSYYSRKYRAEPEGQKYTHEQRFENPLSKVLTNPDGISIGQEAERYILEKDATWGTTQEEVDVILDGGDPLEGCKPIYIPIEGVAKKLLIGALLKLGQNDAIAKIEQYVEDSWVPVLAFIPDAGSVFSDFSVSVGTAQNERAKMNEEDDPAYDEENPCETLCERSFVEEVCKAKYENCRDVEPPKTGYDNFNATSVGLTVKKKSTELIFPIENRYRGYLEHNSETKWTLFGMKKSFGNITTSANAMSIKVIAQNITNDYDDYVGNVDGDGIVDVIVPDGGSGFTRISMQEWHNRCERALTNSITEIQQKLNFRVIGLDFSFVSFYLDPKKGLQDIQVSYDENGFYADLTFATRPKQLQNKESLFSRIGPVMKLNSSRSPMGSISRKGS